MAIISIIAAVSRNNVIGKDNKLPWYIPEDLEWFKSNTLGKPVIMGRKTHESIGKKLPGRLNIVISRNENYKPLHGMIKVYGTVDEAVEAHKSCDELVIIGGEQIYKEALPLASKIYLTNIHKDVEGDAFFPELDLYSWNIVSRKTSVYLEYMYEFQILEKKQ
jgi:dihydrofolate reductase